jgi:hypothetical protein
VDWWSSLKGADGLVAMTSGWRWKDLSECLDWISTGNYRGVGDLGVSGGVGGKSCSEVQVAGGAGLNG